MSASATVSPGPHSPAISVEPAGRPLGGGGQGAGDGVAEPQQGFADVVDDLSDRVQHQKVPPLGPGIVHFLGYADVLECRQPAA